MTASMRESFREHHRLTPKELESIWQSCVFAFDTNVLLNIYRYADSTREDLFRVLQHLQDRIWVPYRVAEEFYANRIGVIREQAAKFEELTKTVQDNLSSLQDGAFRKSGFLKVPELEQLLKPAVDQVVRLLEEQRAAHPNLLKDDPYLERLVELVGSSIGPEPSSELREKDTQVAQARLERNQPPGTGPDARKPIPDRYGDVLIWLELLALGTSRKKPVVFVTDEVKEDWWQVVAGRRLGPRPELRQEMRKSAGVEFYIYNPARLFELVGETPDLKVAASTIDDAKKITEELQAKSTEALRLPDVAEAVSGERRWSFADQTSMARASADAVRRWIAESRPDAMFDPFPRSRIDVAFSSQGKRVAVEVTTARHVQIGLRQRLADVGYRAHYALTTGKFDEYQLVIVAANRELAVLVGNRLGERPARNAPRPTIIVGFLEDDRRFRPTHEVPADLL